MSIHPHGQAELGRLLVVAAQSGVQLLVETHSDHIVDGVRIAARTKQIGPEKIVAFYFKRNEEDNSADSPSSQPQIQPRDHQPRTSHRVNGERLAQEQIGV